MVDARSVGPIPFPSSSITSNLTTHIIGCGRAGQVWNPPVRPKAPDSSLGRVRAGNDLYVLDYIAVVATSRRRAVSSSAGQSDCDGGIPGRRVQRTVNFDREILDRARAAATYLARNEPSAGIRSLAAKALGLKRARSAA